MNQAQPKHDSLDPPEYVNRILALAVERKATDVYWLPGDDQCDVRFRVDGRQQHIDSIPVEYGAQCVARLKVLAGMLTYRTQIAQDGAIAGLEGLGDAEMRMAVMPTRLGERATIRIMARRTRLVHLEDLGFPDDVVTALRENLLKKSGMIVLTGPTGCGKTTTIYAMIRELLRDDQDPASIITIEDPVEREIPGVSQVSVTRSDDAEWGYAQAFRAALRQDVKTLVIGEMRDRNVVNVALDAALSGHRVITTFHAGDAPSVYARILHYGFEPFLIGAAISGVVAQRLVKRADGTGVVPIVSFLEADDQWREFVTTKPSLGQLRKSAASRPCADLTANARALAERGVITEKDVHFV